MHFASYDRMHGFCIWIIAKVKKQGRCEEREEIACVGSSRLVLDVEFRVVNFELLAGSLAGNLVRFTAIIQDMETEGEGARRRKRIKHTMTVDLFIDLLPKER